MTPTRCNYRRKRKIKRSIQLTLGISVILLIGLQILFFSSSIFAMNPKEERQQEKKEEDLEQIPKQERSKNYVMNEEMVSEDYFKDALFIGDSRTQGFMIYTGLDTTAYTSTGLTVDTVLTKEIGQDQSGNSVNLETALQSHTFEKIYIMLGINELGWVYSDIFIEHYRNVIKTLKLYQPNAVIYIESILPVTESKSAQSSIYKNSRINEYNQLIQRMAEEESVVYLNVREALETEEGALPSDAATDGIHLTKDYCEKWLYYIKTHTIKEKNI